MTIECNPLVSVLFRVSFHGFPKEFPSCFKDMGCRTLAMDREKLGEKVISCFQLEVYGRVDSQGVKLASSMFRVLTSHRQQKASIQWDDGHLEQDG